MYHPLDRFDDRADEDVVASTRSQRDIEGQTFATAVALLVASSSSGKGRIAVDGHVSHVGSVVEETLEAVAMEGVDVDDQHRGIPAPDDDLGCQANVIEQAVTRRTVPRCVVGRWPNREERLVDALIDEVERRPERHPRGGDRGPPAPPGDPAVGAVDPSWCGLHSGTDLFEVGSGVDPLENPDDVVLRWQWNLPPDDPSRIGGVLERVEDAHQPTRRVRMTETRFVEQAVRMRPHLEPGLHVGSHRTSLPPTSPVQVELTNAAYYPTTMANRALRIGVSGVLAAGLLAVFLWNVPLDQVGREIARAHPMGIVLSVAAAIAGYWLRAVRWQLILRPAGHVRHSSAVLATASGYAAMTLLPARMGDLVRPLLLVRREPRIATSAALASILTERIFDLWTVVLFFLVFLIFPPTMAIVDPQAHANLEHLTRMGWIVGLGLVAGTAVLAGLLRYQRRFVDGLTRPLLRIRPAWQPAIAGFLNHFLDGLRVVARPRDLALTLGMSLLLWYVIYWQVQFVVMAFDVNLPLRSTFLLVTLAVIGLAIPTPGGVGGFHAATKYGLTAFFGVGDVAATSIAIAYHAISFVPITLIGLACLPAFGVRLREVEQIAAEEGDP